MMVSQELAEYEAEMLLKQLIKRAQKLKIIAEERKKKILKKEMAQFLDRIGQ